MNLDQFLALVPPAFTETELYQKRREPLMNYTDQYEWLTEFGQIGIKDGFVAIEQKAGTWGPASVIAEASITVLSLQYSAGDKLDTLRAFYPATLWAWEEYLKHFEAYSESEESRQKGNSRIPAISFADQEYGDVALPLACFGLLLGHADLMPRLVTVWDYINEELDYYDILLERLVSPFVPGRRKNPQQFTRHLPYRKLDKVFNAAPEKRPALMTKYLDEWYHASRREPYYDKDDSSNFKGYWSWEAAAVTWLLGIDDSSYRDMDFYPRDLADYAKQFSPQPLATPPVLSALPGQPCPQEGEWYAVHLGGKTVSMKFSEPMPGPEFGPSGKVVWYLKD